MAESAFHQEATFVIFAGYPSLTPRGDPAMPGKAAKVVITERQQDILQRWVRSRSCPRGLAQRAEVILLAFDGWQNGPIADHLGCERHAVGLWRRRWADAFDTLVRIECLEGLSALETAVEGVLSDNPRSGCPSTFAPEQIARIIAVACEPPEDSDRPVTHWTPTELAEEVVARGIVPAISVRHVGRFLKVPNSSLTGVGTG
jgi:putative transposase